MRNGALEAMMDQAKRALVIDSSERGRSNISERPESVAIKLVLEWLTGRRRFESQSHQTDYCLLRFYEKNFFDRQPEATRIYERFRVNLPRARYLARLLRARRACRVACVV
jgi:hypothetical protein